jgi:hypothetical protein
MRYEHDKKGTWEKARLKVSLTSVMMIVRVESSTNSTEEDKLMTREGG